MSLYRARLWKDEPDPGKAQVVMGWKTSHSRMELTGKNIPEEQANFASGILFMQPLKFHRLKQLLEKDNEFQTLAGKRS